MLQDTILCGDALATLRTLPSESVQCVVTSPPYFGLRDYGADGQIGLEATPDEYVAALVVVFAEVRRVLHNDGTLWLNLGDSYCTRSVRRDDGMRSVIKDYAGNADMPTWRTYAQQGRARYSSGMKAHGLKDKDLMMMPARVALALQADGWWIRSEIVWAKKACMPESVTDRPTRSHEMVYLLTKSQRYYYDAEAIAEDVVKGAAGSSFTTGKTLVNGQGRVSLAERIERPKRNKRDVWLLGPSSYAGAHFATMPPKLVEPCILAGCPAGGIVLDPFMGSGTVGVVARRHSRHYLGVELNAEYVALAERRIADERQPVLWSAVS